VIVETDQSLSSARRHEVEDLLAKQNATYQINLYAGASHGFAVRVDLKNQKQVYAKEAAFYQALLFFDEWLKGSTNPGAATSKYVANGHWENSQGSDNDLRVQHDFDYTSK
jgi:Dienelactone hydrolase family